MIDDERANVIFEEMDKYVLELSKDPASLGPNYFQDVIATCRNYLNRVSLVVSELNRERLEVSGELRALEAAYELERDDLLANNPQVKTLSSVEDRKATVGSMLREQRVKINKFKGELHRLDAIYKVVSYRNKELHATMAAIKDQRRLVQIEVDTGSFYGDERTKGSKEGGIAVDDDINEQELADMFAESSGSENEPVDLIRPGEEKKTESEDKKEPTEEDVLQFLDSQNDDTPQRVVPQDAEDTTGNTDTDSVEDVLALLEKM